MLHVARSEQSVMKKQDGYFDCIPRFTAKCFHLNCEPNISHLFCTILVQWRTRNAKRDPLAMSRLSVLLALTRGTPTCPLPRTTSSITGFVMANATTLQPVSAQPDSSTRPPPQPPANLCPNAIPIDPPRPPQTQAASF